MPLDLAGSMSRTLFLALTVLLSACSRDYDRAYSTDVARPAYETRHPVVLIDQAHNNRHSVSGSYKPFTALAKSDGYAVRALRDPVTSDALAGCEIFVIPAALGKDDTNSSPAFSQQEVDAIVNWVQRGGSLLLITDHHPFGGAVRNLAMRLGVEMHNGMTFDPVNHDRSSGDDTQLVFSRENGLLREHPIMEGRDRSERVSRVVTFTGQSLRAGNGVALLSLGSTAVHRAAHPQVTRRGSDVLVDVEFGSPTPAAGYAQAIALTLGAGRVVVFGEAAMASAQRDGNRLIGMNLPGTDNRQFVLNTLHWLTRLLP